MKNLLYVSVAIAAILGSASLATAQNGRVWLPSGPYANEYNRIIEHPVRRGHNTNPAHDVYDSRGQYLGPDPDPAVRREIARDSNPGS
jgi:hypothetical protein